MVCLSVCLCCGLFVVAVFEVAVMVSQEYLVLTATESNHKPVIGYFKQFIYFIYFQKKNCHYVLLLF